MDRLAWPYKRPGEDEGARLSDQKVEIHRKVATLGAKPAAERLRLIGEGLPVLLASAQELADAEKQLPRKHQRARAILIHQAEEEANRRRESPLACPATGSGREIPARTGRRGSGWFYRGPHSERVLAASPRANLTPLRISTEPSGYRNCRGCG